MLPHVYHPEDSYPCLPFSISLSCRFINGGVNPPKGQFPAPFSFRLLSPYVASPGFSLRPPASCSSFDVDR